MQMVKKVFEFYRRFLFLSAYVFLKGSKKWIWVFFREFNHDFLLFIFPDLKKHFEVPPYSQQVALGSQVQMRCHPPKGKPAPTIKWLQNGSPISPVTNKNFIITGEGHLIVVNATLADTANYTCVAENVATKRLSAPATINVYGKAYLCKKNPFPFPPRKTNFPSNHFWIIIIIIRIFLRNRCYKVQRGEP